MVKINLNKPMSELRAELSKFPVTTRLSLTGTMVVARDIAHAKILERIQSGQGIPQYMKDYMIYYAGPAKTPEGYASGSFGTKIKINITIFEIEYYVNQSNYFYRTNNSWSYGCLCRFFYDCWR